MPADFKGAKGAATRLLLEQRLYSLRIDVTRLAYDKQIIFDSMQNFCTVTRTTLADLSDHSDCLKDGCTFIRCRGGETYYVVLYNQMAGSPQRMGFTLAHEVGHIYLDHLEDGDIQEQEANCFAAQLLAPEVLVHALCRRMEAMPAPEDLCRIFALSRQAAENRIMSLVRFPNPRFSPEEQILLRKMEFLLPDAFEPHIDI